MKDKKENKQFNLRNLPWGIQKPHNYMSSALFGRVLGVGVRTWGDGGSERREFLKRYEGTGDFLRRRTAIQLRFLSPSLTA